MKHVLKIGDSYPVHAIVETTDSKISLALAFHDEDDDVESVAVLLDPVEATQLAVALLITATGQQRGSKSGGETRGPS